MGAHNQQPEGPGPLTNDQGPLTDNQGAPGPLSENGDYRAFWLSVRGPLIDAQGPPGPLTNNQGAPGPLTEDRGGPKRQPGGP